MVEKKKWEIKKKNKRWLRTASSASRWVCKWSYYSNACECRTLLLIFLRSPSHFCSCLFSFLRAEFLALLARDISCLYLFLGFRLFLIARLRAAAEHRAAMLLSPRRTDVFMNLLLYEPADNQRAVPICSQDGREFSLEPRAFPPFRPPQPPFLDLCFIASFFFFSYTLPRYFRSAASVDAVSFLPPYSSQLSLSTSSNQT